MKKFLASNVGKRVLIGLGMIAIGVALWFATERILGRELPWQRGIQIIASIGTGIAGLLFMAASWKGLLWGYGWILFLVLPQSLPDPWDGYFSAGSLLILIAGPTLYSYYKKKKKKLDKSSAERAKQEEHERLVSDLAAVESESVPRILVQRTSNRALYEAVIKEGELLFFKLDVDWEGNEKQQRVQPGQLPAFRRGDFSIAVRDITMLRVREVRQEESLFDTMFSIYVKNKRYYLATILVAGGATLERYLREHAPKVAQDERRTKPRFVPSVNQRRRKIIKYVYLALCALALLAGLAWLFLDVPYELFGWLSLLPFPALMTLYCLFPNEITITENKAAAHGRVVASSTLYMFSIVPLLRFLMDFNILAWGRFWIVVGVLLLGLLLSIFLCSEECQKQKVLLLAVAFALLIYLVGATGEVNYLLDREPPQEWNGVVTHMHISSSRKSPDRYYLEVKTSNQPYDLMVGETMYHEIIVGDKVHVLIYPGALGIAYAVVEDLP